MDLLVHVGSGLGRHSRLGPAPPSAPPSFVSVPPADYIFTVVHDEAEQAYKAVFEDEEIGYLSYRLVGGRVVLWSVAVLPEYRDHGVAAELIAKALDDNRASGKKVTVICPIVRTVIDHHPQYEDLVDKEHPGSGSSAPPDLVEAMRPRGRGSLHDRRPGGSPRTRLRA